MNILFLSLGSFNSYEQDNIYADILRCAIKEGHSVLSLLPGPSEGEDEIVESMGNKIIRLRTGKVTGDSNFIRKGISTLRLGGIYKRAIKKYCGSSVDIILYSTPPITLYKAIKYAKKSTGAKTYLLLKDIFPQNAVDLGLIPKSGWRGIIYRHFRKIEKKYYVISDRIGCMSEKNVQYLLQHNDFISPDKVCVNPNSTEIPEGGVKPVDRAAVRKQYGIPEGVKTFIYGGNLGRPQDVEFIVECLKDNLDKEDRYFVVCGSGGDYDKLEAFFKAAEPRNMLLIHGLEQSLYDRLVAACDIGLIFLDQRFTIPNYPSRLLSYMKRSLPVIACVDSATDVGDNIEEGGFGWKCPAGDCAAFTATADTALKADLETMGKKAYEYLVQHFSAQDSMRKIIEFAENK